MSTDIDFDTVRPGNLENVTPATYATFVGLVISGEVSIVVDSFGRLATMLDERPLGAVAEKLDNVRVALTELLDASVTEAVKAGVVDDEFVTGYEAIKNGEVSA